VASQDCSVSRANCAKMTRLWMALKLICIASERLRPSDPQHIGSTGARPRSQTGIHFPGDADAQEGADSLQSRSTSGSRYAFFPSQPMLNRLMAILT
jgi:hypothetical protein